jgi:hypothetical protein
MLKIFISFSTIDGQDVADHVYSSYRKKIGYSVFLSSSEITYGDESEEEIGKNIEECDIFLVIATYGAIESEKVAKEIIEAKRLGKRIIPCKFSGVEWSDLEKWGIDSKQGLSFRNEHELVRKIHPQLSKQLALTLVRDQRNDMGLIETRLASSKYEPSLRAGTVRRVPSAYIVIKNKLSKLQLEHEPMSQDRVAYYERVPEGTISFGERFRLIIPQTPGIFKYVESAGLWVNDDIYNENDYLHTHIDLENVRDARFSYIETYLNGVPHGLGDGYTANEQGFKIFLWWQVLFTDGTEQTYVAILHLKGDPCEKHGWYRQGTRCFDFDE